MIQHIVLLKLKAGTTEEQKQALLEGLVALQREHKIAGIESVSGGITTALKARRTVLTGDL